MHKSIRPSTVSRCGSDEKFLGKLVQAMTANRSYTESTNKQPTAAPAMWFQGLDCPRTTLNRGNHTELPGPTPLVPYLRRLRKFIGIQRTRPLKWCMLLDPQKTRPINGLMTQIAWHLQGKLVRIVKDFTRQACSCHERQPLIYECPNKQPTADPTIWFQGLDCQVTALNRGNHASCLDLRS